MAALAAAQDAFVIEQIGAPRDFAIGLPQPRFHNRGEDAADNVLPRACASRALDISRGGNAGNAISNSNHGNLLSQPMRQQTAFEFASVLRRNIACFSSITTVWNA
jgi:hypothetical protein